MKKTLVLVVVFVVLLGCITDAFARGKSGSGPAGQKRQKPQSRKFVHKRRNKSKAKKAHSQPAAQQAEEKADNTAGTAQPGKGRAGKGQSDKETKRKGRSLDKVKGKGGLEERSGGAAKGKNHQQQLRALRIQMLHEEAKHKERVARLERILALARESGNDKLAERVEKLRLKEQQRYEKKLQRMQRRGQKIEQLAAGTGGGGEAGEQAVQQEKAEGKDEDKGKEAAEQDQDENKQEATEAAEK